MIRTWLPFKRVAVEKDLTLSIHRNMNRVDIEKHVIYSLISFWSIIEAESAVTDQDVKDGAMAKWEQSRAFNFADFNLLCQG